jgi:aspartyl-tRNA(Asn)/glutamyl-tRNA(Gln) amidotransferase subunit B
MTAVEYTPKNAINAHGYEMVIGLEVHAQVNSKSKLFSPTSTSFGADPNTQVNEIDLGMPGVLPVLNEAAVDAGILLGLAIDAQVRERSVFARKNYFYPDLPKGYQISQFELPIVEHGKLDIDLDEGVVRTIGITRMHLEEDAGKSVHDIGSDKHSHVDLNRAGIPLMEIVSEPDMRTPEEAGAYLRKLKAILEFLGICDADMEKGQMRCDANVSVRKIGVSAFGTRCEIKNLNSIRNVMRAIQHEAERQVDIVERGGSIDQETRLYDAVKNETRTMRSKEDAMDYRYFPDPDLLPLVLDSARIEKMRGQLPELPDQLKKRFIESYGLSTYDASVLTMSRANANYYEEAVKTGADAKLVANWMTVELFAALNKLGKEIEESPVSAENLAGLVKLISDDTISGKIAKQVLADMLETGKSALQIVDEKGLKQITNTGELAGIVKEVVANNPESVAKFKEGNERVFGFFVGQVMKATQGKANPKMVNDLIKEELNNA